MSVIAVVLVAAALLLLGATEWPRLNAHLGVDARRLRERSRRKSQLQVITTSSESDDFARSVERDLAKLPTIDERDAKKR